MWYHIANPCSLYRKYQDLGLYTHTHMHPPVGTSSRESSGPPLQPGDMVEVCDGDLMHLQGKVLTVEGETITIIPKHEDLKVRVLVYWMHMCSILDAHV